MNFHSYRSLYSDMVKRGRISKQKCPAVAMSKLARQFYDALSQEGVDPSCNPYDVSKRASELMTFGQMCMYEAIWYRDQRPYYNVWPSILDMLLELDLSIPATSLVIPHPVLVIRLPVSFKPFMSVFVSSIVRGDVEDSDWSAVPDDVVRRVWVGMQRRNSEVGFVAGKVVFDVREGDTIEECMGKTTARVLEPSLGTEAQLDRDLDVAMKIACGVSILAHDPEFVQPIILNKDQPKYEEANAAVKKYLEDKAANKQGRGFSVGKELESQLAEERKNSPHLRRPHMCLFWTGKGRSLPKIKLRRGAVIHPKDLTQVPTGYLDQEECNSPNS